MSYLLCILVIFSQLNFSCLILVLLFGILEIKMIKHILVTKVKLGGTKHKLSSTTERNFERQDLCLLQ
jgi:hypothetical protein